MDQRIRPFDTIENAQGYIRLLGETVSESKQEIEHEIDGAADQVSNRRLEALRLVDYHLEKLQRYLSAISLCFDHLRSLRSLILEDRPEISFAKSRPSVEVRSLPPRSTPETFSFGKIKKVPAPGNIADQQQLGV